MSLRRGLVFQFAILITIYTILNYVTHKFVIYPNFLRLEREEAEKDLNRFVDAFKREQEHLDRLAHDWAAWDATYRFVQGKNRSYKKENLGTDTYTTNNINAIYIIKNDGSVAFGQVFDLKFERVMPVNPFGLDKKWPKGHKLTTFDMKKGIAERSVRGIIQTKQGLVMVAARPITTADHKSKSIGTLLMARFVDDDYMEKLSQMTKTFVSVKKLEKDTISIIEGKILNEINEERPIYFKYQADELLDLYTILEDIYGEKIVFLIASVSRDISLRGKGTILFGLGTTLFIGLVLFVLLGISVKVSLLTPLQNINKTMAEIARTKNFDARVRDRKKDEIGAIVNDLNYLLDELAKERAISDAKSQTED